MCSLTSHMLWSLYMWHSEDALTNTRSSTTPYKFQKVEERGRRVLWDGVPKRQRKGESTLLSSVSIGKASSIIFHHYEASRCKYSGTHYRTHTLERAVCDWWPAQETFNCCHTLHWQTTCRASLFERRRKRRSNTGNQILDSLLKVLATQ